MLKEAFERTKTNNLILKMNLKQAFTFFCLNTIKLNILLFYIQRNNQHLSRIAILKWYI